MCNKSTKYWRLLRPIIFADFLCFCNIAFPQNRSGNDTIISIIRISPGAYIHIRDSISFFSGDTLLRLPPTLIPATILKRDKNFVFFDSLKVRASKNQITRKLFDFVIVSPVQVMPISSTILVRRSEKLKYKD
jgi:hypothetical protein